VGFASGTPSILVITGASRVGQKMRYLPMRIAQIAPLYESVPPKLYGGTERVASYLTEELVRRGHEVTLFASGDSETKATLVPVVEQALRLNPQVHDAGPYHVAMLEHVAERADEFDVLHFHTEFVHFPVVREFRDRTITTLHGRTDLPDQPYFYETFKGTPLAAISNDQRMRMPGWNWAATVHNGLPRDLLSFSRSGSDGYLAFLGRISPEKGPDAAIEIAAKAGLPLKLAAKIDAVDRPYWDSKIEPLIHAYPNIEYIGEIDERQKSEFLGGARALLFPITWPEPFGLVMIESFACGTPVIAYRSGSVTEVVDEGHTGFVVDSIDEAVHAVGKLDQLDRTAVRRRFERRFTAEHMADGYERVYRNLVERSSGLRIVA
jgi:glycosyltransferase involved in cell wall biosynthesis